MAAAGAAGVSARYAIGQLSPSLWVTLAINVAGSLLLGLLLAQGRELAPEVRDALGVGFLGGFTTFSTFSLQAVLEADGGRPGTAAAYVGASVVLGVGAACAGFYGGRAL